MTTTNNLPEAVNAAAEGLDRLATDMVDLADLISMAFGLDRPETPKSASAGRLPAAVERLNGSLVLVATTCAAASGRLDAVTWQPRCPEALEEVEAPETRFNSLDSFDLGDIEAELDCEPDPVRAEEDASWRASDFADDAIPETDPHIHGITITFGGIGADGCLDGGADLPPANPPEKTEPRPRSGRSRPKKPKKKSH